jgi:hypothetical protein
MRLLGQQVPRRSLDARPPQRLTDEAAFGVAIGIAVARMLPGEPVLQTGVLSRKPHPAELRERAVQMVFEVRAETGNECNTVCCPA